MTNIDKRSSQIDLINKQNLSKNEVINELFAFSQKTTFQFLAGKQSFKQRCDFSEKFTMAFLKPIKIDPKLLDTKSNLRFEVLEEFLSWFNISITRYKPYKHDVNQLVNVRNAIAHGENSIILTYFDLEKYIKVVNDLFDITILNIHEYLLSQGYKKCN
ncbi:MAG TPA: MAE_28990/MAE_18760 family HEPN-like nuclease [Methylomusa anaerophila]|uniref:MAE_28990/MAE_18760 family HEPN-like nuclease n=1 Tax=Methylomusa anaerophila TaxID=1930071 RepID=UPI000F8189F9|nr:MAE_28990/MAE_18760 family HEPN-like nuclease [Methylomusa anaerophila]HML90286.1 MAE_28990/MAE_18760 family HEPN-like nuclease [Methylomusa anaerophila]